MDLAISCDNKQTSDIILAQSRDDVLIINDVNKLTISNSDRLRELRLLISPENETNRYFVVCFVVFTETATIFVN